MKSGGKLDKEARSRRASQSGLVSDVDSDDLKDAVKS